jgi:lipopolysaccharide biosynthesis glycosyltransferase
MKIDLVFSVNAGYLPGLLATINSIIQNTAQPERLRFNIIIPKNELQIFENELPKHFHNPDIEFRFKEYIPTPEVQDYIVQKYKPPSIDRTNALYMLFARLFLGSVLPDLKKVIYLDTDIVVVDDIALLYDSINFSENQYFAAVPHFFPAIFHFSNPFKALHELRTIKKTFNGGVLFTDLSFWKKEDYQKLDACLEWDRQCGYKLLQLNDETLLNLMFKDYVQLDRRWNCCGFGNTKLISWLLKKDLSKISIIHWSGGHHKPWNSKNIPYADIWSKYAI